MKLVISTTSEGAVNLIGLWPLLKIITLFKNTCCTMLHCALFCFHGRQSSNGEKEMTMTTYTVVKTSTNKFRIKATWPDGSSCFVGGLKSKKCCFWIEEEAQKFANDLNETEKRDQLFLEKQGT